MNAAIEAWVLEVQDSICRDHPEAPRAKRRKLNTPSGLRSPMSSSGNDISTPAKRKRPVNSMLDAAEDDDELGDPTPRGKPASLGTSSWPKALTSNIGLQTAATTPSSSSTSRPSKRSRSPTKSQADLSFANFEIRNYHAHEPPPHPCLGTLLEDIESASEGLAVFPAAAVDTIIESKTMKRPPQPHQVDQSGLLSGSNAAIAECRALEAIIDDAADCEFECEAEVVWNARVHDRLLRLCMESSAQPVKVCMSSTATIVPPLLPRNVYTGDTLAARLVDFCVAVKLDTNEEDKARHMLSAQPDALRTVNQTMYPPLVFRPIALAVETKIDTASETGKSQLAVWSKAWLNRQRLLEATTPPPLPLLRIVGHLWYLLLAWEEEDTDGGATEDQGGSPKLVLLSELLLGDTSSLASIYRLAKSLRLLASWAGGPFKAWYCEDVLHTARGDTS